jgi:pyruvate kinase
VRPRRTKIVATLGPASGDRAVVGALMRAGMDVARINLSHGSPAEHRAFVTLVRESAARMGLPVAVLADLPGPKLRVGDLEHPVAVATGDRVMLGSGLGPLGQATGTAVGPLPVNFPDLLRHLEPGQRLLVDDGAVALRVVELDSSGDDGPIVALEAENAGAIGSRKGVNLPDTDLPIAALTEDDDAHLRRALEHDVDLIALSFVRRAADVELLRRRIAEQGGRQLVVAKIEKREALARCDEIVAAADAVMIARGDLGVEIPPAEVPVWQKRIIRAARAAGKPVITATQMLQSMIEHPRPTRAEASDVANAIYDSTCAVMLSGETAVGAYPIQAVATMAEIARTVEADLEEHDERSLAPIVPSLTPAMSQASEGAVSDAISYGACDVARRVGAAAIVTATATGATARAVAKYRPREPIVAVSPDPRTVRQLALTWGVTPLLGADAGDADGVIAGANDLVLAHDLAPVGAVVVMTAGVQSAPGATNLIKAHVLATR